MVRVWPLATAAGIGHAPACLPMEVLSRQKNHAHRSTKRAASFGFGSQMNGTLYRASNAEIDENTAFEFAACVWTSCGVPTISTRANSKPRSR